VAAFEAILTEDVRAVSDGAGEYHAARKPIVGRRRVATFYRNIAGRRAPGTQVDIRMLNGLPALMVRFGGGRPGEGATSAVCVGVADDGRIRRLHTVLATRKLTALGT